MIFFLADKDRYDYDIVNEKCSIDIELGGENDFQIEVPIPLYKKEMLENAGYVYCSGTEYGGRISDVSISTEDGIVKLYGQTFRGMLGEKVVEPPSGQAYLYISGDLNECLEKLISTQFGSLFEVTGTKTGVSVTDYKVNRYDYALDAINSLLNKNGYRLNIEVVSEDEQFSVILSAVEQEENGDEISQDYGINFSISKKVSTFNYIIALGGGQLEKRTVIYLHQKEDGSIEKVSSIPSGEDVRVYKYDYSSSESSENPDELFDGASAKFEEINERDSQTLTIDANLDLNIGDIVSGKDFLTGIEIRQPVTKKIIKVENENVAFSYEIGG